MTLGFYAPLPPLASGVADYAACMRNALLSLGAVRVNSPGQVNLYHIGNNRLHAEIYRQALREPGVALLHDALLHHLLLGMLDEDGYLQEFTANYGVWTEDLARRLWKGRAGAMSDPLYFRYPLLKRLATTSLGVVVHHAAAREAVLAHHPEARVLQIPHLNLEDPARRPTAEQRAWFRREQLGVRDSEFLMGVYGHLRETKRLASVLAALDALRQRGLPARLLVAGAFASDDYERALRPVLAAHPAVVLRGATEEAEFRLLLASADVCVNLRYPAVGESSGIGVRAMALGVPLVVSEGMEEECGPPGVVAPVCRGPAEVHSLAETLIWLAKDAGAREGLALAARKHCLETRDPARVCQTLWTFLQEVAAERIPSAPPPDAASPMA